MNAACAGPMSALISLLSAHGVLTAPLATVSQARTILPLTDRAEQPITQFVPPDSPPPRA